MYEQSLINHAMDWAKSAGGYAKLQPNGNLEAYVANKFDSEYDWWYIIKFNADGTGEFLDGDIYHYPLQSNEILAWWDNYRNDAKNVIIPRNAAGYPTGYVYNKDTNQHVVYIRTPIHLSDLKELIDMLPHNSVIQEIDDDCDLASTIAIIAETP